MAEPSIRHKEDATCVVPNRPYFDYALADAHLRLLVSLASCGSAFGPPIVRSLWRLLTDFGGRWKDIMVKEDKEEEGRRRRRRRSIIRQGGEKREEEEIPGERETEDEEGGGEGGKPVPGMGGLSVDFVRDAFSLCNGDGDGGDDGKDGGGGGTEGGGDERGEENAAVGEDRCGFSVEREEIYSDRFPSGR